MKQREKEEAMNMNPIDLIVLNLEETRRRSLIVWRGVPLEYQQWRPDPEAMSFLEMVRHVLHSEYCYHQFILNRGSIPDCPSPYDSRELLTIEDEIAFSQPYRQAFLEMVRSLRADELSIVQIDRSDVGYVRSLGDFLMRIAYHEAVHTGQMLQYMRMIPIPRPMIWD
jgi:uncharacterized damage-inducible protein DinB